jgi:hypothetical protein
MTSTTTLYLDMDGVVADWLRGATKVIGYELADPNAMYPLADWEKLKQTARIFRTLPKTQRADELVNIARRFRSELDYSVKFLTAIPHNNDMPWAFYDKVMWAQDYYPDIPVMFGPYSQDKYRQCRPLDILVDDRSDNCAAWRAAGGRAVQVAKLCNLDTAIETLLEILEVECEARPR